MTRRIKLPSRNYAIEGLIALGQLFSFLSMYLIARFSGLGIRGELTYFITTASIISIIVTFSVDKEIATVQDSIASKCNSVVICKYRKILSILPFMVVATFVFVSCFLYTETLLVKAQSILYILLLVSFEICQGCLIGFRKIGLAYFLRALQSIFFSIFVTLLITSNTHEIKLFRYALILSTLLALLFSVFAIKGLFVKTCNTHRLDLRGIFRFHLTFLTLALLSRLDLIFLKERVSDYEYGLYVVCGTLGQFVVISSRGSNVRELAGIRMKRRIFDFASPIFLMVTLLVFTTPILRLLYGPLPADATELARILLFAGLLTGISQTNLLVIYKKKSIRLTGMLSLTLLLCIFYLYLSHLDSDSLLLYFSVTALLTQFAIYILQRNLIRKGKQNATHSG
jgi:hypothetical protein